MWRNVFPLLYNQHASLVYVHTLKNYEENISNREIVVMVCDNCEQSDKKSSKTIHNSCIYLFFCTATPINTPITMRKRRAHAIPAYAPCERLMLESGSPFLGMITGSLCSGDSSYATISLGSTIKSVSWFSSERESWIVKLLKHIHPAKQYR